MAQTDNAPSPETLRDVYELMEEAAEADEAIIIVKKVGGTWDSTLAEEVDHRRSVDD